MRGFLVALAGACLCLVLAGCSTLAPALATPSPVATLTPLPRPTVAALPSTETPTPPASPAPEPTAAATATATDAPTVSPSATPVPAATESPTVSPSATPTTPPTAAPTATATATTLPTSLPTAPADQPYITGLVVTPEEPPVLYAIVDFSLHRSADGGRSWAAVPRDGIPPDATIISVAIDYRRPSTMYVTTNRGLFRREGEGWTLVHTLFARSVTVDLANPQILWAGVGYSTEYGGALVLKSEDGGRTWAAASEGIVAGLQSWVAQILIDPNDPGVMYANLRDSGRFGWPSGRVYRGGRAGRWEELVTGPTEGRGACYANGLAFDPSLGRLWVGCDAYYYNENDLLLLRTDNPGAVDARTVLWERLRPFDVSDDTYVGLVQPLAVDAREPKALYLAYSASSISSPGHRSLRVSHDEAATWEVLSLPSP